MGVHVGINFVELHGEELLKFVHEALLHGYGSEDIAGDENTADGSSTISYKRGDWEYRDVYYGGEPYSGMTTVFYCGLSCWAMVYFGKILPGTDKQYVYDCLRPALLAAPKQYPFRGPSYYMAENSLEYVNIWDGDIVEFHGHEVILDHNDQRLFHTHYHGGAVNIS